MVDDYMECMGLRIKELRTGLGLSQALLAEMAHISRSQLSEIETERKPANTRRLKAIAQALGVELEDLFTTDAQTDQARLVLDLMRSMPAEDQDAILRHARALAGRAQH
jgi:transcriptional regulator with XRE-family HTH domain